MVGAKAGGVVAAVADLECAGDVEAEEIGGGKATDGVAAVGDGDAAIAPTGAAALPLPAAAREVDAPLREQALDEPPVVSACAAIKLLLTNSGSSVGWPWRHLLRSRLVAVSRALRSRPY